MQEMEQWLWDEAHTAAIEVNKRYVALPFSRYYLYYKPAQQGVMGGVFPFSDDVPHSPWVLAEQEYIPRNMTVEQCTRWIVDRMRRLPIIAW
jgi:hypothetical protein